MSALASIRAALIFFAAVLVASSSWALDRNGNWWLTLAEHDRPIYIVGFFDGMEFQLDRAELELTGMWQAMSYPKACDDSCKKIRFDQSLTHWKNLREAHGDFNNPTAGQLVAGVDSMYSDYRNRAISVKDVLSVVIWNIKGVDQKMIDGRLGYLRGQK
jgi:hypothetical protein